MDLAMSHHWGIFSRKSGNHTRIGKPERFGANSSAADSGLNVTIGSQLTAWRTNGHAACPQRLHVVHRVEKQRRRQRYRSNYVLVWGKMSVLDHERSCQTCSECPLPKQVISGMFVPVDRLMLRIYRETRGRLWYHDISNCPFWEET